MGRAARRCITAVTYRTDEEGYLKPGFSHIFLVSADGGAPRQLSFGRSTTTARLRWTPDGRTLLFSGNRSPNWEREALNTEVYALDIASERDPRADRAATGRTASRSVSPDGRLIAYTGFDDRELSYENALLYVMDARRRRTARALTGVARPQRRIRRSGRRTAARSTSPMTIAACARWPGSASTARSAPSPRG